MPSGEYFKKPDEVVGLLRQTFMAHPRCDKILTTIDGYRETLIAACVSEEEADRRVQELLAHEDENTGDET